MRRVNIIAIGAITAFVAVAGFATYNFFSEPEDASLLKQNIEAITRGESASSGYQYKNKNEETYEIYTHRGAGTDYYEKVFAITVKCCYEGSIQCSPSSSRKVLESAVVACTGKCNDFK